MERTFRSLKEELHQPPQSDELPDMGCALDQKKSCCDGVGYRLKPHGSLTHAELCNCVSTCVSCYGKNRKMVDGLSRSCRTPAPSRIVNFINSACLPARYSGARLDSFSNFTGNGREVVTRMSHWYREFDPERPRGLLLGGPVGVGKTYMLCAIAKNFAGKGISVRFIDFFQLLLELKAGYAQDKSDATLLNDLIEVDILFIDELGKGRNSDWELSVLDQLVMGRYNRNKIIVASTNYDLKPNTRVNYSTNLDERKPGSFELDRFESLEQRIGPRIYSRLFEISEFIELTGDDFRKRALDEKMQGLRPQPPGPRRGST
ncbi:MAG: ATP-binding protein [Pseudobdellovibrionaceae bacterium]|nr:ATP-binding protein [Pseudobdellovibrionaceae bacterium]